MSMIIKSAPQANNDFEPDPILDTKTDYDAVIVGVHVVGTVQADVWNDAGQKTGEVVDKDEVMVAFQLVEDSTKVERGDKMVQRYPFFKYLKYSGHELANFHKIAAMANGAAAWVEDGMGMVNPELIIGCPVSVTLKTQENGKQSLHKINPIPSKYRSGVSEAEMAPFCFDANSGPHAGTSIADVPAWLLKRSLEKTVKDVEWLSQIDQELSAREAAKEQGTNGTQASDAKKAPAKKEAPTEEAPAKTKRVRKSKAAAPDADAAYTVENLTEAAAEDMLCDNGFSDEALDNLDTGESDEAYHAALVAECNNIS